MAVSKTDLLQYVAQFQQDNKRPCPKSSIVATHGESALLVLRELVDDKSVNCRRGRNGGYYPTDTVAVLSGTNTFTGTTTIPADAPIEAGNAPASDVPAEAESEDLAAQFAALEAKLAAAEAEEQSEQVPF
jgi:hypothetical protein